MKTAEQFFNEQSLTDANTAIDKCKTKFTRWDVFKFAELYAAEVVKELKTINDDSNPDNNSDNLHSWSNRSKECPQDVRCEHEHLSRTIAADEQD